MSGRLATHCTVVHIAALLTCRHLVEAIVFLPAFLAMVVLMRLEFAVNLLCAFTFFPLPSFLILPFGDLSPLLFLRGVASEQRSQVPTFLALLLCVVRVPAVDARGRRKPDTFSVSQRQRPLSMYLHHVSGHLAMAVVPVVSSECPSLSGQSGSIH